jgi:hypoxanthine phosphoribosyltransferase
MSDKIQYTDQQMRGDLLEIIRQISMESFKPDIIVGIARGGLIPATMLSHYFVRPLLVINYSLRDNMVDQVSGIGDLTRLVQQGKKLLMVDDICDSGETLAKIVEELTENPEVNNDTWHETVKSAVLWNNINQDAFTPNYVGREISRADDDRWVVFSYEEWWKA